MQLKDNKSAQKVSMATLAGGCFWCTEAVFKRLKGVEKVISGYAGGKVNNATYLQVSIGETGHAEAIQITFDPLVISYETLLEVFWKLHDPTTVNRQGADVGNEYRSIIFYHNKIQQQIAEKSKENLEKSGFYDSSIVTQIIPFREFFPAEDYHQDYYEKNAGAFYCKVVIDPKIAKLTKEYGDLVKSEEKVV